MAYFDDHFDVQTDGLRRLEIDHVRVRALFQKGHYMDSFLKGLFRRILPLLSKGAKAVNREAVKTGTSIEANIFERDAPLSEAFRTHTRQAGKHLKRKAKEKPVSLMKGSRYSPM